MKRFLTLATLVLALAAPAAAQDRVSVTVAKATVSCTVVVSKQVAVAAKVAAKKTVAFVKFVAKRA